MGGLVIGVIKFISLVNNNRIIINNKNWFDGSIFGYLYNNLDLFVKLWLIMIISVCEINDLVSGFSD